MEFFELMHKFINSILMLFGIEKCASIFFISSKIDKVFIYLHTFIHFQWASSGANASKTFQILAQFFK